MLSITIPEIELHDEKDNTFVNFKECYIELNHSLVSLSKWESKWKKSFVESKMNDEELIDYIRCMTLNKVEEPDIYKYLPPQILKKINDYMDDPMSATIIKKSKKKGKKQVITSEVLYSWMINLNIPIQFETWHLNRLVTMINLVSIKNAPKGKKDKVDMNSRREENRRRREKHNTKG